jgi:hypothetical protein
MATWKKIVVSGSGVSQLSNDAGYVASIGGGLISSSQQISDFNTFLEFQGDNVVSSSAQVISLLPAGTVSGSSQITISSTTGYTTFSSSIATDITSNTSEISSVSSSLSARITSQENFSSSLDATFATDAELSALSSSASTARDQIATDYIAADSALSGSASTARQAIADDLSTVSSSFSTRITAQENFSSSLDATFATEAELNAATASLSGSASAARDQIAVDYASADSTLSASLATDISTNADNITTNTNDIATLNGKTLISGSTFSSPSQGTLRATINGVASDVDLGLQTGDNVEFADALITGDLTVQGTASFQHTEDLDVADRFIRLASGSNANGDGGIVIQQDSATNGEAFAFDNATSRWGVTSSFDPSTNTIVPDAFMTANVTGADNDPTGIAARYQKNGNIFVGNTGDIWIYS